jgi:hypothetical protein
MKRVVFALVLCLVLSACGPSPTPTPTPTPRPTATDTPLPTEMPEPVIVVPTDTPVATETPVATDTALPTATPIPPTATPYPTDTPVPPTATPHPTDTPIPPTATPIPTATEQPQAQPAADVKVRRIFYDGKVPKVESDEYAEIVNQGTAAANLAGWRLNAGAPGQDFIFPDFVLEPGQACRVYTNEAHPETCGFSFNSGQAVWRNSGDCGYLYDASGALVSEYCY